MMEPISAVLNRVMRRLSYGNCSPEEQQQIAIQLDRAALDARKMERSLDELAGDAHEDALIAEDLAEARAVAVATSGNVVPLPRAFVR